MVLILLLVLLIGILIGLVVMTQIRSRSIAQAPLSTAPLSTAPLSTAPLLTAALSTATAPLWKPYHPSGYKQIFVYWDDPVMPPLVHQCVNKMQRQLPDFAVHVWNRQIMKDHIPPERFPINFHALSPNHQCDWLRLFLLDSYGGIYMDASIVINDPSEVKHLHDKVFVHGHESVFLELPHHRIYKDGQVLPTAENWLLVSRPQARLLREWLKEYERAIEEGFTSYAKMIFEDGYVFSDSDVSHPTNEYHTAYKAFQVVMNRMFTSLKETIFVHPGDRTFFKIQLLYNGNIIQIVRHMIEKKIEHNLKLTKAERDLISTQYMEKFSSLYFV